MPVNLQKGQKIDLTKNNPSLKKIIVGLGWDAAEMDELTEVIGMTRLGQKLVDRGREEGREEERREIAESLIGLLDERVIAERTGLPLETVLKLKKKEVLN